MPTSASVAKRAKVSAPPEPVSDVEVLSYDEDRGTFDVRLCGVEGDDGVFVFWNDTNFFGMLIAYGGEGEDLALLSQIIKGMLWVPDGDEDAGRETWRRFTRLILAQRGMSAERTMTLINDLIAAAGKDQQDSAGV